jgi:hypothetical protein
MCENVRVDAEEIQEHMWDEVFPLLDQHFFQVFKQIPVLFLFVVFFQWPQKIAR